jgi:hypothetical protein
LNRELARDADQTRNPAIALKRIEKENINAESDERTGRMLVRPNE